MTSAAAMAIILLAVGLISAVLYNLWHARAHAGWDSLGTGLDQSGALLRHEARYEEARRGNEALCPAPPLPRDHQGNLPLVREVMGGRLQDPACPPHLLDAHAKTQHLRTFGHSSH